jgi:hypothetical protein
MNMERVAGIVGRLQIMIVSTVLVLYGYIYQDFESFLRRNNIFADREYDSSNENDNANYYEDKERSLTAKVATWPYQKIVCFCIFYTLSRELEKNGCISSFIWMNVIPNLTSSLIGPEVLTVIKRNNFFQLDPTKVIKAASHFFRNNSQIRCALENFPTPKIESGVIRVLKLLQVDIKVAQELITQAIRQKDTSVIVSFLDNYVFP